MKKNILYGLAVCIAVGGVFFFFLLSNQKTAPKVMLNKQNTSSNTGVMTKNYSLAEVSKHNNSSDCWMIINNKVYDVSNYIKLQIHPGGEKILMGCGKEATDLFNTKGGKGSPHSLKTSEMLQEYYVGNLKSN